MPTSEIGTAAGRHHDALRALGAEPVDYHDPAARGRLEVSGLVKSFGSQQVLRGVTLSVDPGSTTAIVGPSGSGKTTLLRLIAGFERAEAGSVTLSGRALAGEDAWVPAHHRDVGYVAQDGALFPHLTAAQNVELMARHLGWDAARIDARRRELVELTRFPGDALSRYPAQLSGGQRQRVGLMRALFLDPALDQEAAGQRFPARPAGRRARQQRIVELLPKLRERMAHGRLTEADRHGSPAHVALGDQRVECKEQTEVHRA